MLMLRDVVDPISDEQEKAAGEDPGRFKELNGQVKPYQVRQFLQLVEQYSLKLEE